MGANEILDMKRQLLAHGLHPGAVGQAVEEMSKALETTSYDTATAYTGGRALQFEFLDNTMKNAIITSDEFTLTKALYTIPGLKRDIKTTEYKSVRKNAFGNYGAAIDEGGVSQVTQSDYERLSTLVKTISTKRGTTLHAKIADMIQDPEQVEYSDGALVVNSTREIWGFWGNKSIVPQQFDGFDAFLNKTTVPNNIFDIRGATIDSSTGEAALTKLGPKSMRYGKDSQGRKAPGRPTHAFLTPDILGDVQDLLRDRERYGVAEREDLGTINPKVYRSVNTPYGMYSLIDNIFMNYYEDPIEDEGDKLGSAPTLGTILTPADASSLFGASDAGDYYYQVQAVNAYGRGGIVTSAAVTVASGDKVTIPIVDGVKKGTGYYVYRSKKDAADSTECKFIGMIARDSSGTTTFTDLNEKLPGTQDVYIMNLDAKYQALQYVNFIEMMRFNLYSSNEPIYPFLVLCSGAMVMDIPQRHARITNVSPKDLGWY